MAAERASERGERDLRGRAGHRPQVRPLARAVAREALADRTMLVAAGLAFFAVFGLLPAIAVVAIAYGYFVDEEAMRGQLAALGDVLSEGMADVFGEFLTDVPEGLGFGLTLAFNLLVVLWTVQRSASGVITALNVAYDVEKRRSRVHREVVALAVAAGGVVFLFASLFLVAVLPLLAGALGAELGAAVRFGRWPLLAVLLMTGLALLYTFAPSRDDYRLKWVTWGAAMATVLWLLASVLFSLYLAYGGDFGTFYGSLAGAVVLMTWLFLGAFVIMVGAEINAQLEEQMLGRRGVGLKEQLDRR